MSHSHVKAEEAWKYYTKVDTRFHEGHQSNDSCHMRQLEQLNLIKIKKLDGGWLNLGTIV